MEQETVLSLPLIFWRKAATDLHHSITALAACGSRLVTGSASGELVMWVSDQGQCQARVVATARLGLECRQLAFVRPPYEHALGADCWVVSLHDDNRVRVWDWYDGRCLSATSQTFLQPLARATLLRALQERLLAIGGEDNVLHIVDSWTLTKLSSYRLPGRLVDLAAQTHDHGGRLLALCGEDQVLLWELSNAPGFLIDDYCPRPMDSRPTLKLTMRTSELPRLISLSQDCSLLVVAYENIISFVHESWVSATQFYKTSRDEAYMCMSSPVVTMTFTEGTFVVGLENGLLAEFEIREIMSSAGIGEPGERKVKGNASTGEGEISPLSNERELISLYGRKDLKTGILVNMTAGGEGTFGYRHTEEAKLKNRLASLGPNNPQYGKKRPEHSKKLKGENNPCYGRVGEKNPMFGKEGYWKGKERLDRRNKVLYQGVEFESQTALAKHLNCTLSNITRLMKKNIAKQLN